MFKQHKWFILMWQADACSSLHSYNPQNCGQVDPTGLHLFFLLITELLCCCTSTTSITQNTVNTKEPQFFFFFLQGFTTVALRCPILSDNVIWFSRDLSVNGATEHSVKNRWTWQRNGSVLVENAVECSEIFIKLFARRKTVLDKLEIKRSLTHTHTQL